MLAADHWVSETVGLPAAHQLGTCARLRDQPGTICAAKVAPTDKEKCRCGIDATVCRAGARRGSLEAAEVAACALVPLFRQLRSRQQLGSAQLGAATF